jgi:hypothetical protein
MPVYVLSLAILLFVWAGPADAGNIVDIIQTPVPQHTKATCQSYSAAVMLAFQNDPAFPINTVNALRDAEVAIRSKVEGFAADRNHYDNGKLDPRHDDIVSGFAAYTSGAFTLQIKSFSDITALGTHIGNSTAITNSATFPFPIATSSIKEPVMISVKRVGSNVYKSGHLVTVFGVSGPPNSTRQYLILNSAVKVGAGTMLLCDLNAPASQTTYGALTAWTNDIEFKDYSGKYFAFNVNKK